MSSSRPNPTAKNVAEPYGSVFGGEHAERAADGQGKDTYDTLLRVDLETVDPTRNQLPSNEYMAEASLEPGTGKGQVGILEVESGGRKPLGQPNTLFGKACRIFRMIVPYGGLLSCCFNLASTSLGAGIVAIPSAFNLSGVAMATVYLILVAMATAYALNLLAKVITKTGLRTYSEAARTLLGPGADYLLSILLLILCFGGSTSYIITMGSLMRPVLSHPSSPAYLATKSGNRLIVSMMWLVLMVPLVIPKKINSLRYFSGIGVSFIVYFVVCMVYHSATHGFHDTSVRKQMVYMRSGNAALEGLGSLLFAYMSQINAFEIYSEMARPSVGRFTLYSIISMLFVGILYFLSGFFGYADFGSKVVDSILSLYDPVNEPYIMVGYVGIVVKICVAFAMHFHPLRDALYYLLGLRVATLPYWLHSILVMIPCTLALICGLFIPTLNTVLGLLGSLCGGTIGMIMPSLFIMYCGHYTIREVGVVNYVSTLLLLVGGVVAVVFGTTTTIYSTVGQSFVS
ncbi:amino acid transporter aATP11 [Strigomonas culicis]|uniref:Amino acid transporter aATP11 n=2 Tax=Strigomonas culicis TaxID=28005 RepID=S9V4R1_9TRYP|nr:amino acid transporter aATP11 [Strigomonas culicis]|eukprot:EPY21901.1 amino acid transporter aATP11 [Strigomonas culicis]